MAAQYSSALARLGDTYLRRDARVHGALENAREAAACLERASALVAEGSALWLVPTSRLAQALVAGGDSSKALKLLTSAVEGMEEELRWGQMMSPAQKETQGPSKVELAHLAPIYPLLCWQTARLQLRKLSVHAKKLQVAQAKGLPVPSDSAHSAAKARASARLVLEKGLGYKFKAVPQVL